MTAYRLTWGLGLIEVDITVFEGIGSKKHRKTTTQGITKIPAYLDEILKEEKRRLTRQTSMLDILESSSGNHTTEHRR